MQSIASLMSFGKSDIGNMDDIDEEEVSMECSFTKDSSAARLNEITSQFAQFDIGQDDDDMQELRGTVVDLVLSPWILC